MEKEWLVTAALNPKSSSKTTNIKKINTYNEKKDKNHVRLQKLYNSLVLIQTHIFLYWSVKSWFSVTEAGYFNSDKGLVHMEI